jgi:hypothetical protein
LSRVRLIPGFAGINRTKCGSTRVQRQDKPHAVRFIPGNGWTRACILGGSLAKKWAFGKEKVRADREPGTSAPAKAETVAAAHAPGQSRAVRPAGHPEQAAETDGPTWLASQRIRFSEKGRAHWRVR